MALHHLDTMVGREDTVVAAMCEPSPAAYEAAAAKVEAAGGPRPPNEPDWRRFIEVTARQLELDAVMIVTPHAFHFAQATAALEAGLDVLLEKPMVMNAIEAVELIRTRDRTGRLLVVGFQGSLSPHVRAAATMLRSGELGAILNVNALVWQDWHYWSQGTWRENPVLSGGGFMFDTGAHLRAAGIARLASGALITMNGCGRAIPSLGSDIRLFCERGTLRTGIWGERLEIQRHGAATLRPVRSVRPAHVWQQFVDVRAGRMDNPSPPEVGLRMARLWDAIRESSSRGGAMVSPAREADAA